MKKILIFLVSLCFLLFPMTAKAVTADTPKIDLSTYKKMNFKEILAQEGIKEEFSDYTETDDQVTIYLFRGNGCGYCRAFLTFLNGITNEYGKYFKVVGFEVWYDADNSDLLKEMSSFTGESAGGVPYIIIGKQVFPGYASNYDDAIKEAIQNEYNAEEKYDVFEEYNKAIDKAKNEKYAIAYMTIGFCFVFIAISTFIICKYIKKQNDILLERIAEMKEQNKTVVKNEVVETPKRTKNAKKKK